MFPILFQNNFVAPQWDKKPRRIISLVPSQTELLAGLGLDERVVGITRYCIYPKHWQTEKVIVGGTKKIDIEKIKDLQPDLIIAAKEENVQEQVEALAQFCPVYVSNVNSFNFALEMILQVGLLVGSSLQAESLVHEIVLLFEALENSFSERATENRRSVAYLIWRKPYMAAGGDTFIHDMLHRCGWQNVLENETRYPELAIEQLEKIAPQVLMLSSEPYPFAEKHIEELELQLPQTKIILVDGEMFSWYGSRLLKSPAYFKTLQEQLLA